MSFLLAYIDPGAGSLIVQVLLAIVLGIGVFFRAIKAYIFSIFNKFRNWKK